MVNKYPLNGTQLCLEVPEWYNHLHLLFWYIYHCIRTVLFWYSGITMLFIVQNDFHQFSKRHKMSTKYILTFDSFKSMGKKNNGNFWIRAGFEVSGRVLAPIIIIICFYLYTNVFHCDSFGHLLLFKFPQPEIMANSRLSTSVYVPSLAANPLLKYPYISLISCQVLVFKAPYQ